MDELREIRRRKEGLNQEKKELKREKRHSILECFLASGAFVASAMAIPYLNSKVPLTLRIDWNNFYYQQGMQLAQLSLWGINYFSIRTFIKNAKRIKSLKEKIKNLCPELDYRESVLSAEADKDKSFIELKNSEYEIFNKPY